MSDTVIAQAERIASDYLLEQVLSSYPIIGKGFVNQVYVVETQSRKVVVRMNDVGTYPSYAKEKWCMEQAAAVGIPGPEVLSIGLINETAYMIMNFVEGDNGLDSSMEKNDIWRELGRYANLIHSIPVKGYGEILLDPEQGQFYCPPHPGSDGSWLGYVEHNIHSLMESDRLIELGVYTLGQLPQIRELFVQVKHEPYRFGLNHQDLSLKNAIVDPSGRVVLIDWGNAEVRPVPHGDLNGMMHAQIADGSPSDEEVDAFLEGYGINRAEFDSLRPLLLLKSFDTLRWAIDKCPERIEDYAAFAKKVVDLISE